MIVAGVAAYAWLAGRPDAVALPFGARDFVLVTAFENRTGEPLLDGTLEFALERELSNSSFVNVVPRVRIQDTLALMRQPPATRIDVSVGREVAIRDGKIRALVAGRVERLGASYAVAISIVKPADGSTVLAVREASVAQLELLDAVGRIARTLRERLGESFAVIEASRTALPKVTTSSLRALELYTQARVMAGDEGGVGFPNPQAVEQLLREALREDPHFVMAHVLLAQALSAQPDQQTKALEHADLAVAAAERGTAIDRYLVLAEWHVMQAAIVTPFGAGRLEQRERSAAAYEALLRMQPDHEWALSCLTNIYPQLNRPADAVRAAERLVELRPNSLTALWRAARATLANNQVDSARRFAERANALDVPIDERNAYQAAWVRAFNAHQAWLRHDPQEASRIADRMGADMKALAQQGQRWFALQLMSIYLMLGQLDRAEQLIPLVGPPAIQRFQLTRVATATLGFGVTPSDRTTLRAVLARHYPDAEGAINIMSVLIDAGQLSAAHRALALATAARPLWPPPRYLNLVRGQLALAEGRPREAITHLERPVADAEPFRGSRQWARTTITLANAHVAIGNSEQAVRLLEDAAANRAEYDAASAHAWLAVRGRLAQLYRQVGRDADAEAAEAELVVLLAVADENHPINKRLKQLAVADATKAPVLFRPRD